MYFVSSTRNLFIRKVRFCPCAHAAIPAVLHRSSVCVVGRCCSQLGAGECAGGGGSLAEVHEGGEIRSLGDAEPLAAHGTPARGEARARSAAVGSMPAAESNGGNCDVDARVDSRNCLQ